MLHSVWYWIFCASMFPFGMWIQRQVSRRMRVLREIREQNRAQQGRTSELDELYERYERLMDRFDRENVAANPDWDGVYTPDQREQLDAMMARGRELIGLAAAPERSCE